MSVTAKTYLAPKLLISRAVTLVAKSLLQESQQDGDNDARLQCLTEQDEEDLAMHTIISIVFVLSDVEELGELTRHSKYVDRHGEKLRPGKGGGVWGEIRAECLLSVL